MITKFENMKHDYAITENKDDQNIKIKKHILDWKNINFKGEKKRHRHHIVALYGGKMNTFGFV